MIGLFITVSSISRKQGVKTETLCYINAIVTAEPLTEQAIIDSDRGSKPDEVEIESDDD